MSIIYFVDVAFQVGRDGSRANVDNFENNQRIYCEILPTNIRTFLLSASKYHQRNQFVNCMLILLNVLCVIARIHNICTIPILVGMIDVCRDHSHTIRIHQFIYVNNAFCYLLHWKNYFWIRNQIHNLYGSGTVNSWIVPWFVCLCLCLL